ncbi:MAG: glycosyltransferase family 1 protein, partial [Ruminococcus sp.]|nr:glycosyltransferase family 1 protein [Ruminococcus sp.]
MKKGTKKVGVLGHFGFGLNMTDGQTVKTLTVAKALQERCGEDEVICADTHGGAKALPKLPFQVIKLLKKTNNVVILPAQRGVQVIVPLLAFFNRFFRRRLHYCVVGGWLPRLVADKKRLVRALKSF